MTHPFTTIVRVLRDQPRTQNHVSIEILLNGCLGLFNCFLRSTYNQHINDSGQDSLKFSFELHYFGPNSRLAQTKTAIPIRSVQNADCRLGTKYRLGKKMQTADWVQNANWEFHCFFRLIRDNISSYNLPSITQSLFRNHLLRLFASLWNIPFPFLDHRRS